MLRLIAVGVAVTCSLLIAAPVPKPTERELKARWGEIVKGAEEDRFQFERSSLTLTASPRKVFGHGLGPWDPDTPSPRTRHVVRGDFDVSVKLTKLHHPDAKDADKGSGRLMAGLYLRDDRTLIVNPWRTTLRKLDRLSLEFDWTNKHDHRLGWSEGGGRCAVGGTGGTDGTAIWLRIRRKDDLVFVAISGDEKEWCEQQLEKVIQKLLLAEKVEIGVFVCPDEKRKVEATFSDFKLTVGRK